MKFLEQLDQVLFEDENEDWDRIFEYLKESLRGRNKELDLDEQFSRYSPPPGAISNKNPMKIEYLFFDESQRPSHTGDAFAIHLTIDNDNIHIKVHSEEYLNKLIPDDPDPDDPDDSYSRDTKYIIEKHSSTDTIDRDRFDIENEMVLDHIADVISKLINDQRIYRDTLSYGRPDGSQ